MDTRGPLGNIRLGRTLPIYDDISVPWYFVEAQGSHNPPRCGPTAGITVGVGIEHLKYSIATGGELERDYLGLLVRHNMGSFTAWANLGRTGSGYGTAAAGSSVNAISRTGDSGATMWTWAAATGCRRRHRSMRGQLLV